MAMTPTILSPVHAIRDTQARTVFDTIVSPVLAIASIGRHCISHTAKHCAARALNELLREKWVGSGCRLAEDLAELQYFDNYQNTQVDWHPSMYAWICVTVMACG